MQLATYLDHAARVERLVAALRADLSRPISLGEMGEIAAMSPFHLTRVVRELTGLPPVALHAAFRVQEAKRLLLTTDAGVTDACFEVGFSSLGSFSSRFAADVGATPSEFKRAAALVDGHAGELADLATRRGLLGEPATGIRGEVVADGLPDGLIFVGLFPHGVAKGLPASGDVLLRPGPFAVGAVPDGRWNVLVAHVPAGRTAVDWIHPDVESRVGIAAGVEVVDGSATRPVVVHVRHRRPIDAPVLLSLLATPRVVDMMRTKVARMSASK